MRGQSRSSTSWTRASSWIGSQSRSATHGGNAVCFWEGAYLAARVGVLVLPPGARGGEHGGAGQEAEHHRGTETELAAARVLCRQTNKRSAEQI